MFVGQFESLKVALDEEDTSISGALLPLSAVSLPHAAIVFTKSRNLISAGAVAEEAESVLVALDFINSRGHFPGFELRFAFNAPLAPTRPPL